MWAELGCSDARAGGHSTFIPHSPLEGGKETLHGAKVSSQAGKLHLESHAKERAQGGPARSGRQYLDELRDALWSFSLRGFWSPRLGGDSYDGSTPEPGRENEACQLP